MLGYDVAAEALEQFIKVSEDGALQSLKEFCRLLVSGLSDQYLPQHWEALIKRIMSINSARGFPRRMGRMECQKWEWQKCPMAWTGKNKGKKKRRTIIIEAIFDGE